MGGGSAVEKNEQNVSAIEGDGMEVGSGEGDLR